MKLESFQRAVSFLRAHGIEPGLDMLSLEPKAWNSLLALVREWERANKMHRQPELTTEELELEKKAEDEELLYWSVK